MKRDEESLFYTLGCGLLNFCATVTALIRNGLITATIWTDLSVPFGIMAMMLVMTIGLSTTCNQLKEAALNASMDDT